MTDGYDAMADRGDGYDAMADSGYRGGVRGLRFCGLRRFFVRFFGFPKILMRFFGS